MKTKIIEVRDEATFFALLCVDMNPGPQYPDGIMSEDELKAHYSDYAARLYHLRRCGYPCDGRPNIGITHLRGDDHFCNDPYKWGDRTRATAHAYIIEHWETLRDGDVVDVQFILGETAAPKVSERFERKEYLR